MADMIDLNEFMKEFNEDPEITKLNMVRKAISYIEEGIKEGIINYNNIIKELENPDYSEICDYLGWPDFQDGGIFEQCIDIACDTMLQIYDYKPLNYLNHEKAMREKYGTKEQ